MPPEPDPSPISASKASEELAKIESARVWHLYVLQCADGSLYCGIALDVMKRLGQHQRGRGAKYTRSRLPVYLVESSVIGPDIAEALRAERQFKALPRAKKLKILKNRSV